MTPEERLDQLATLRAARKDESDLPRTMTPREVAAYGDQTRVLEQRLVAARNASAVLADVAPLLAADAKWRDHLGSWRDTLAAELLAMNPRIRNEKELDQKIALDWSIKLIDHGLGIATLPILTLEFSRIGALMKAAGYEVEGEALRGPRGWRGPLQEVETRLKELAKRKAGAEAVLTEMLLTDAEQAERDAERAKLREALSTMQVRHNAHGDGLVALTLAGDPLPESDMTEAQRDAFAWQRG